MQFCGAIVLAMGGKKKGKGKDPRYESVERVRVSISRIFAVELIVVSQERKGDQVEGLEKEKSPKGGKKMWKMISKLMYCICDVYCYLKTSLLQLRKLHSSIYGHISIKIHKIFKDIYLILYYIVLVHIS